MRDRPLCGSGNSSSWRSIAPARNGIALMRRVRNGSARGSAAVTAIHAVIASSMASRESGVRRGHSSASCSGLSWPNPRKLGTSGWRSIETIVSCCGRPRRARRASRRISASWSNRSCSNHRISSSAAAASSTPRSHAARCAPASGRPRAPSTRRAASSAPRRRPAAPGPDRGRRPRRGSRRGGRPARACRRWCRRCRRGRCAPCPGRSSAGAPAARDAGEAIAREAGSARDQRFFSSPYFFILSTFRCCNVRNVIEESGELTFRTFQNPRRRCDPKGGSAGEPARAADQRACAGAARQPSPHAYRVARNSMASRPR